MKKLRERWVDEINPFTLKVGEGQEEDEETTVNDKKIPFGSRDFRESW